MSPSKIETCLTCGSLVTAGEPCIRCALELALFTATPGSAMSPVSGLPARRFGDYELLTEIARGGMGAVWRARQISLNRIVALKLLLESQFASESAVARFEYEAEAAANLQHPNIVPIYDFGQQEGRPFIAMKLIEGESLADLMRLCGKDSKGEQPKTAFSDRRKQSQNDLRQPSTAGAIQDVRACIVLLAKIARTVNFAHLHGILHRDLKPSNILIDEGGEPHVIDFGIAKAVAADGRMTQSGAILGSPFYMSPEQASGKTSHLSVGADIYSLGVILYELLTGRLPFEGPTPVATLKLVLETETDSPRSFNSAIPADLATICLKCLAKDPAARYETAAAFGADLEHWLKHEPIHARPAGPIERSWKWMRRHPLKAALAGMSVVAIFGPLLSTFYLYNFVLPMEARAHPIVGMDVNIPGYSLSFDTGRVDRATMNFDHREFARLKRNGFLYFTNVPPEVLVWSSNLSMQVFGDIPAAPDQPRGPVVRAGQWFAVDPPRNHDRAYYICPFGWDGNDVLVRAPNARLVLMVDYGVPWKNK